MTTKMEKKPAVVMDKPPVDPLLCQCVGVQRRWDIDGYEGERDGVKEYRCSVCGKRYR